MRALVALFDHAARRVTLDCSVTLPVTIRGEATVLRCSQLGSVDEWAADFKRQFEAGGYRVTIVGQTADVAVGALVGSVGPSTIATLMPPPPKKVHRPHRKTTKRWRCGWPDCGFEGSGALMPGHRRREGHNVPGVLVSS